MPEKSAFWRTQLRQRESQEMADTETADIVGIVDRYGGDPGMLIPMMQDVQEECGYLPQMELKKLSGQLELPISRIYSVASFYSSFRLMPKGDHTIQLCMGTVCFLKGAGQISESIQKEFDLVPGGTSEDRKFTYCPVNCVGACALAPVMVVDGEYFGGVTVDSAVELLHNIAEGKVVAKGSGVPDQDPTKKAAPKKKKKKKAAKKEKQQGGDK
jgi:NADH-quinone oxidoreductase subunit E